MRKLPAPVKWLNRLMCRIQDQYDFNYSPEMRPWRVAAIAANKDVKSLRNALPAYTPKRSYYGAKGSLYNPFHK